MTKCIYLSDIIAACRRRVILPGTGLGLAIAQSLVQEMQGFIEVISPAAGTPWMPRDRQEEAGLGTVFIVWLLEVDR